jgi:hypothetical protein
VDKPTFGGVKALQAFFADTDFPLPDFLAGICTRFTRPCGSTFFDISGGTPVDLALQDPGGNALGTALVSREGGYGIRIVADYHIYEYCLLSYDDERTPIMHWTVELISYGPDAFRKIVEEHYRELTDIVRYEKVRPTPFERAMQILAFVRCRFFTRAQTS